jgi:ferrous iron transport protein B
MMEEITIALVGNPNSGKTTLFNNLTGAHQHVGNWPGVTVEKKEGRLEYQGYRIRVVDLPGVYSLTAYSLDEVIARNFVVDEKPQVVVDVVDASSLERSLNLTVQLLEMGAPVVVALNMMDEAESKGYSIDVAHLSDLLGVPVVPMMANRNRGTAELLAQIIAVAKKKAETKPLKIEYGRELEEEISHLENLISQTGLSQRYPHRWLAVKLLEGDEEIVKKFRE